MKFVDVFHNLFDYEFKTKVIIPLLIAMLWLLYSCEWDDLENFFIRIAAHNKFFGNVPYQMIGFAYNSQQEFCAVLVQPYILAEREATEDEIAAYMQALGFEMDYYDEYHNSDYEVFDAVPNNVLYGIDGDLYFIDTQIRLRS